MNLHELGIHVKPPAKSLEALEAAESGDRSLALRLADEAVKESERSGYLRRRARSYQLAVAIKAAINDAPIQEVGALLLKAVGPDDRSKVIMGLQQVGFKGKEK